MTPSKEFLLATEKIMSATSPASLFGNLPGDKAAQLKLAKRYWHRLLQLVSPDRNANSEASTQATRRLNTLWDEAKSTITAGTYGIKPVPPPSLTTLTSRRSTYQITQDLGAGDIADVFAAVDQTGAHRIIKVARLVSDSDLMAVEMAGLTQLRTTSLGSDADFLPYLAKPVESFTLPDSGRVVNVFTGVANLHTLTRVHAVYPGGIDVKDMAWIWRRLLNTLSFVHARGVIHGNLNPENILIEPDNHGLVVIGWCASIGPHTSSQNIPLVSQAYEKWYAPEILKKEAPSPGSDIYLAARTMIYVLGGDPVLRKLPSSVPVRMSRFLTGCLITSPALRPRSAAVLREEFDRIIVELWGARKFHVFKMPTR